MKKKKSAILFILSVVVIFSLAFISAQGVKLFGYEIKPISKSINKGLDLQGGVSVVEEIQGKVDKKTFDKTIELISMRVNKMGVSETVVTKEGQNRIRIEIPGKFDAKAVIDSVVKTGELKFVGPDKKTILTGKDVKEATAYLNDTNSPTIGLELNQDGTKKFAEATKKFINQPIAIYMDDEMLTNPTVNDVITGGKAVITGSKTLEEATRQANIINSGALPVTLKTVSAKTVGATLGATALPKSIKAGAIGIALVFIFMLLYYRLPGMIADIALVLYIILVLLVFSGIEATLTLSGIAGFLLTVGMAVDANVLIFERIKEELKTGKSVKSSVDTGFDRALSSILDSNITTIIAGVVLYVVGSGTVKGFALTLIIGIVVSIFTALTVTKFLLKSAVNMGLINKPSHFGVKNNDQAKTEYKFKFVERFKLWVSMSLLVVVIGFTIMGFKGLNFGIDFKGGTIVQIEMKQDFEKAEIDKIIKKYSNEYQTTKANNNGKIELEIKSNSLDSNKIDSLFKEIKSEYKKAELTSQETIGASVGNELKKKAWIAGILATLAMLLYIGVRFEFKFGLAAILALVHDILITVSIYAMLQIPVNSPFIAAILTILGYSINDTIVIFDRIRENSKKMRGKDVAEVANISISQTMTRSINTVLTTLFTIVAVNVFVPSVREFSMPLIIGIVSGCYSSIFIASPIWVILKKKIEGRA
nr:protein translocase subunit SecD [Haloimpatiens lingqiaonensis]